MTRTEVVRVDWSDEKSVQAGEKKKLKLENAGYRLTHTETNNKTAILTYEK